MICFSARRSPRMPEVPRRPRRPPRSAAPSACVATMRSDSSTRSSSTRSSRSSDHAAGLDPRHVENVVDDAEQVGAAVVDVAGNTRGISASRASPNIPDCMISEKPMMALSGVRSSWLILARNSDLVRLASSARSFSSAYFSARSTICCACCSSFWRDWRRSAMVAIRRRSPSISLPSWRFSWVMSVPTETKPPSLVRRSLICSQRPSSSCSSKLRAPSSGLPSVDHLRPDQRLAARRRSPRRRACRRPAPSPACRGAAGTWNCTSPAGCRRPTGRRPRRSSRSRRGAGCRRSSSARRGASARVTSTAMPMRCGSPASRSTSSARARSQTQRPSAWRMRNMRSTVVSLACVEPSRRAPSGRRRRDG